MTTMRIQPGAEALEVDFGDGQHAVLPWIWLRDNAPSAFHPKTHERVFDLLTADPAAGPARCEADAEGIRIAWSEDAAPELLSFDFLIHFGPGRQRPDPAAITPALWPAGDACAEGPSLPRFAAATLEPSTPDFHDWLVTTLRHGISIVDGLPDDTAAGMRLAEAVGFLRRTNFGTTFTVESKPDPNNSAYTSDALPLHTDLPNQEVPPGFQFLHCIANAAEGGDSLFADGFAIAAALKAESPGAFQLLSEIELPFRFHDQSDDIRSRYPVIVTDRRGEVTEVRFNAHIVDTIDLPGDLVVPFYQAYRRLMALVRSDRFKLAYRLRAGEMVVFDNRRILHGRSAFDPQTGYRRLEGCYVDRGDFLSRLRKLTG